MQGRYEEGLQDMRQGIQAMAATGNHQGPVNRQALLVEAYKQRGQYDLGLTALKEVRAAMPNPDQSNTRINLHWLTGELLVARYGLEHCSHAPHPQMAAAQHEFVRALDLARSCEAKSWERRAALSLARLWRGQGKPGAARELLAPIYHWFTEGFDATGLQEAKMLLDELSTEMAGAYPT
jgi:hypothetical protein